MSKNILMLRTVPDNHRAPQSLGFQDTTTFDFPHIALFPLSLPLCKSFPVWSEVKVKNCSVLSDSLWLHRLYSPWNSPGQNTGVGSLSLLQGIFPTQGSNPGLPHCRWILYQLSHKGSLCVNYHTCADETHLYANKLFLKPRIGLPLWLRQWRICLQCRRPGFNPWVGKIPWRKKWQPIPVSLLGKSHGWRAWQATYSPWGHKESDTSD